MAQLWYYVNDGDRVGPVTQKEIIELIKEAKLDLQSYVWRKGFSDWMHIEDVTELTTAVETEDISAEHDTEDLEAVEEIELASEEPVKDEIEESFEIEESEPVEEIQQLVEVNDEADLVDLDEEEDEIIEELEPLNFSDFNLENDKFFIRTGGDRGTSETEYGPFSFSQLKTLLDQKRISDLTLVFSTNMPHWAPLGSFEDFESKFLVKSTVDSDERRKFARKPFVARMLYANNNEVFEGICRDLSIGGMQVLMDHFPGSAGEQISLNVHPQNSEYHFVADGKVVRVLEGRKGFSFRFLNLSDEARGSIEQYIVSEES